MRLLDIFMRGLLLLVSVKERCPLAADGNIVAGKLGLSSAYRKVPAALYLLISRGTNFQSESFVPIWSHIT